jgi:hypothetical protein
VRTQQRADDDGDRVGFPDGDCVPLPDGVTMMAHSETRRGSLLTVVDDPRPEPVRVRSSRSRGVRGRLSDLHSGLELAGPACLAGGGAGARVSRSVLSRNARTGPDERICGIWQTAEHAACRQMAWGLGVGGKR